MIHTQEQKERKERRANESVWRSAQVALCRTCCNLKNEKWKSKNDDGKGWKVKYYKGLGTSSSTEFKEYFKHKKIISFKHIFSFSATLKTRLVNITPPIS